MAIQILMAQALAVLYGFCCNSERSGVMSMLTELFTKQRRVCFMSDVF